MKKVIITAAVFVLFLCSCSYNKNTSDISDDNTLIYSQSAAVSGDKKMDVYDFSAFKSVYITGTDIKELNEDELSVLYRQAEYCQAMTDADIDTLRSIVSADKTFTHMSGKTQSREEYFADIADGRLNYYKIGIESPVITVNGD